MNIDPSRLLNMQHNVAYFMSHGILVHSKTTDESVVIRGFPADPMRVAVLRALSDWNK